MGAVARGAASSSRPILPQVLTRIVAVRASHVRRYVSVRSDADIVAEFDAVVVDNDEKYEPDFTSPRPSGADDRQPRAARRRRKSGTNGYPPVAVMAWGLVPSWSKDRKGAGPDDQRPSGEHHREAGVSGRPCEATLPRSR